MTEASRFDSAADVGANDVGLVHPSVFEDHFDDIGSGDDMLVGNDVPITPANRFFNNEMPQHAYDPDKAARAAAVSSSFTFDDADRMTSMTDGEGTITRYEYNEEDYVKILCENGSEPILTFCLSQRAMLSPMFPLKP